MNQKAAILYKASFNPKIKIYLLCIVSLICLITVAGIILIPFFLIFGPFYLNKYFERLECELTTRSLRFKKGYIFHTERTIPLDKIQDLTFKEGPLLKAFGLSILKIETAGSSAANAPDLSLIGIINAAEFRNLVLEQRDVVTENRTADSSTDSGSSADNTLEILAEIRDLLRNIEQQKRLS